MSRAEVKPRTRDLCYGCGKPTIRHEQNGRALCGDCAKGGSNA